MGPAGACNPINARLTREYVDSRAVFVVPRAIQRGMRFKILRSSRRILCHATAGRPKPSGCAKDHSAPHRMSGYLCNELEKEIIANKSQSFCLRIVHAALSIRATTTAAICTCCCPARLLITRGAASAARAPDHFLASSRHNHETRSRNVSAPEPARHAHDTCGTCDDAARSCCVGRAAGPVGRRTGGPHGASPVIGAPPAPRRGARRTRRRLEPTRWALLYRSCRDARRWP